MNNGNKCGMYREIKTVYNCEIIWIVTLDMT